MQDLDAVDPFARLAAPPPPLAPHIAASEVTSLGISGADDTESLEQSELREVPPQTGLPLRHTLLQRRPMPAARLGLPWSPNGLPPFDAPSLSRWQPAVPGVHGAGAAGAGELPASSGPRLVVATMLRAPPLRSIDGFLRYYHAIGFEQVVLFFDKPDEDAEAIAIAEAHSLEVGGVRVHRCDAAWWAAERQRGREFVRARATAAKTHGTDAAYNFRWASCEQTVNLIEHTDDVQARQCAVMSRATSDAWAEGYDWLLQLDIDEILYLPRPAEREDARTFFASLPTDVDLVAFHNHEVMPCEALENPHADWFERTLFKVSPHLLADYEGSAREKERASRRRRAAEGESLDVVSPPSDCF